jgi:polyhydroxyalkanoate synthesis regulator phasin
MGGGAALLAKDKAEELADELVKRGKLTREQTDSFVSRMVSRADEATKSVQTSVAKETEKVVETMGLASAKDVEEIRAELTEIKSLIASLRPVDAPSESK